MLIMSYGDLHICGCCKEELECKYCNICEEWLCEPCKKNPPKRLVAMIKKKLSTRLLK